jgi:hypothetical protein
MTITVGQIKTGVLHQMREFSNSGSVQVEADIKDYLLSIVPLINLYQKELATTTHKLNRKFEISHNMPDNQLGKIVWNEEKIHANSDESYQALGSKAYSFQVSKYATVYIEEEITGVWTNLLTITHTPTSGEGYVTYKGLTNVSDVTNNVRIRFSGSYRYPYRWVALFADNFFDASEVPTYEPYVPYSGFINFYQINSVNYSHVDRQLGAYTSYKTDFTTAEKIILINYYDKCELIVNYFAYPTLITEPTASALSSQDSTALDIADECLPALVHRISSTLLRDENAYMSDTAANDFQIAKAELVQNSEFEESTSGIVINSNW